MISFIIAHWMFAISAALIIAAIPPAYRLCKMWRRRCSRCKSIWVKREHMLEQIFRRLFWSTTTTRCINCGKLETIKERHEREFSWPAWIWRRLFYRKQFIGRSASTERSIFAEHCRAEKLLFMIRNIEAGKRGDLVPKLAKLDVPAVSELSPQRKLKAH